MMLALDNGECCHAINHGHNIFCFRGLPLPAQSAYLAWLAKILMRFTRFFARVCSEVWHFALRPYEGAPLATQGLQRPAPIWETEGGRGIKR
jgi:hypothetical protein